MPEENPWCFSKQCLKPGWDTSGSYGWLADGRLRADTEGLIFAAQDGVLLTRAYQMRVMKADVPISCKVCKQAPETIGHLLSGCEHLKWMLYKQCYDRILYQLVLALCRKLGLSMPEALKWGSLGWDGVGVMEGNNVKLAVDISIPTDRQMTEWRPHLIAYFWESRCIVIFKIACPWEPLIVECQKE